MQQKKILVPIATGIEELETITIIDICRRAYLKVRVTSIENQEIVGANNIKIVADSEFSDEIIENYDALVLPGGTDGAERFQACAPLCQGLQSFCDKNLLVGAICASPALVLAKLNLLDNRKATCYPTFKNLIPNYVNQHVVKDSNIITSQGPGTAQEFALSITSELANTKTANQVAEDMLLNF